MRKILTIAAVVMLCLTATAKGKKSVKTEVWPDGTPIPAWFADTKKVDVESLGNKYVITDFGVSTDSTVVQTKAIQKVIDMAATYGGGVVVVPKGTFLTGSLFLKQGTHLYLEEGGKIKGIDDIRNYPIVQTRMEGQTLNYFAALINADGIDGLTIAGKGTIDGNGLRFWEEFWLRRKYNPQCTNLEAMRPRLVYMSNCSNVTVQDVSLRNSPFWTNHLYKCHHVKYLGCTIFAPHAPVKAPSSDALDIDFCHDVLVDGCNISVNDDAVVLKGGKGTFVDKDPNNGPNYNVIVQNCNYGFVHGCLTLGSESFKDKNIILRNCNVKQAQRVLWLKMRPDTPQHYEYVTVDNITGYATKFLCVRPWTQFYKLEDRPDMPLSQCNNIVIRNIKMETGNFFDVGLSDKYKLTDFTFENIEVKNKAGQFDPNIITNCTVKNLKVL